MPDCAAVSVPILLGPAPRRTISRASVAARRLWDSDYRPALIATGVATLHWPGLEDIGSAVYTTYISTDVDKYRK